MAANMMQGKFMHSKFGMMWQIAVAIFIIFGISLTSLLMALSSKTDVRNCKCFTETGPTGRCNAVRSCAIVTPVSLSYPRYLLVYTHFTHLKFHYKKLHYKKFDTQLYRNNKIADKLSMVKPRMLRSLHFFVLL